MRRGKSSLGSKSVVLFIAHGGHEEEDKRPPAGQKTEKRTKKNKKKNRKRNKKPKRGNNNNIKEKEKPRGARTMTQNKKRIRIAKNYTPEGLKELEKYDFWNKIGTRTKAYKTTNRSFQYFNYVYEIETKTGKKKAYFQIKTIKNKNGYYVHELNYDMFI